MSTLSVISMKVLQRSVLAYLFTYHVCKEFIYTVKISSDGSMFASGSGDKSIKVFEMSTREMMHSFSDAHDGSFYN